MNQPDLSSQYRIVTEDNRKSLKGVAIAVVIITLWAVNLGLSLSLDLVRVSYVHTGVAFLTQTFLYTGLFITAHDAMHRSLAPQNIKLNDQIGSLTVFLYLFFSYKILLKNHSLHHRYPATQRDPDFHDGLCKHPVIWYFNFIKRYFSCLQATGIVLTYCLMYYIFNVTSLNLFLFWILPSIFSSLQLFYFGTFLPHRELPEGYHNPHRTRSNSLPTVLSFLSCYHFGYHEEHHEYPSVPWWKLPTMRKSRSCSVDSNRNQAGSLA